MPCCESALMVKIVETLFMESTVYT